MGCLLDQLALPFFGARARVRVMAVKLRGNFKTSPLLPQGERLCSSSAKTLDALLIPLTTQAADSEETKTASMGQLNDLFLFLREKSRNLKTVLKI